MRAIMSFAMVLALTGAPTLLQGETAAPAVKAGDDAGLGRLLHAAPATVRERLGDPDVARAEGKGAFWTYRLPHCALFLFFHEGPKGLRVAGASTGPRRRGEPLLSVSACLASAAQLPES
jgi:hypothetical protein